ncbi:MAG: hypothetical protein G3M78_11880 [Candidatus Nitrohelix vancouverensis]|uniref:Uncharacterized protein n=1 Tax=Candidatus Nitrohelix vancouverensis TaxID=2705534 RepID=A0A7T0C5F7_9BACT|nr:MAG: hypothetical protein G3M78_11880 [Candidatus Nitrohelix vancouverensis]
MSKGWFDEEGSENAVEKKEVFCEHKSNTVTLDYDVGVEYCSFCGALGHYNIDSDQVEWALPEYLVKQNYN